MDKAELKEVLREVLREVLPEVFQDEDAMFHLMNAIEHYMMEMKSELDTIAGKMDELQSRGPFGI